MTPDATDAEWVALFAPGGTYQDPVNDRTAGRGLGLRHDAGRLRRLVDARHHHCG